MTKTIKRVITETEVKDNSLKIAKVIKKHLKKEIKKGKVAIVAIARGGLIPAQYISYALGIRDIFTVTSRLYDGETKGNKEQEISNLFMIDYESFDYILVIDDIFDTGETMDGLLFALGEVTGTLKEDIKFIPCVAFTQKKKSFMEEQGIIYGSRVKKMNGKRPWLVFPWNILPEEFNDVNNS